MKAKVWADRLIFFCPGCKSKHLPKIVGEYRWEFNGDTEKPTLSPSILVNDDGGDPSAPRCHSFVRDGKIEFLSDCTHELAGQTVELPELTDESSKVTTNTV